jgi:hypothetical protein
MLKVVDLPDSSQIAMRSSAATPIIYKAQFGSDFFADIIRMSKVMENVTAEDSTVDLSGLSYEDLENLDMTVLYQIAWAFAKNADKGVGDLVTWLSGFEEFPLAQVFTVVTEMIEQLFKTSKN